MSRHPYAMLEEGIAILAGRCDGAHEQDGVGFNGRDTHFGKQVLAVTPCEKWSPRMAEIAHKMVCVTYANQLRRAGFEPDEIRKPEAVDLRGRVDARGKKVERCTSFDARLDGDLVVLTSPSFPGDAAVRAVKALPGRAFTREPSPRWTVPVAAARGLIRAIADGHVKASAEVQTALRGRIEDEAHALKASESIDGEVDESGLGGTLRPFQRGGVAYGLKNLRTFLADEMGLGKTVQALAILWLARAFPAVIVVPASLKLNWLREAQKWLPGLSGFEVLSGRKPRSIAAGVKIVILNYDILAAWVDALISWAPKAAIFDESHLLKNGKAARTKAAKKLAGSKTVKVKLCLSGTPLLNSPIELVSQLQILDRLKDLGGWKGFTGRYCIPCRWGGFEREGRNLEELNAKMRAGGMFIRRLKKDVLEELPEKTRCAVPIPFEKRSAYDAALRRTQQKIRAARVERAKARKRGEAAPGWALAAAVTAVSELRQVAAECKLPGALDFIRNMIEAGEKVVVFAHHEAVVERLAAELGAPMIRGGVSTEERQAAVDSFQTDDAVRAIVLNLKAGGVGLTLTAASNVVFVEQGWTPGDCDQAEDRCHRIGQRDNVTAWYLLGEDSIDQWLYDLVARKRLTVDAATEGDDAARRSIAAQLADMLAEAA